MKRRKCAYLACGNVLVCIYFQCFSEHLRALPSKMLLSEGELVKAINTPAHLSQVRLRVFSYVLSFN